jgi:hypothetical protein
MALTLFTGKTDTRVDRVEDAPHQDRTPDQIGSGLRREIPDPVEGQIGPGTGAIEEELEL